MGRFLMVLTNAHLGGPPGENVESEVWTSAVRHEGWTFEHFYSWWSAADDGPPSAATFPAASTSGTLHSTLASLRAKLKSQPYMRTVFRLMEKAGQTQQPLSKAISQNRGKDREDTPDDELCKINISATVGPFEQPACGAILSYLFSPEEALTYRKQYQAKYNMAIMSINFSINGSVGEFELGELAGNLKNILLLTKDRLHCHNFKFEHVTEKGQSNFKVTLIFAHKATTEHIAGMLSALQIQQLEAQIDLSEAPLDIESVEFMRARASLSAIVHPSVVDLIQCFFSDGEEPRKAGHPSDAIALLSALRDVNLNMHFDDVGDLFRHALAEAPAVDLHGWHSGCQLITPLITALMKEKGVVDPLRVSSYANIKKNLRGINAMRLQFGASIFTVNCHKLDVIALLPNVNELLDLLSNK